MLEKWRAQQQLSSTKNDCSLFSRLYIACQVCDGDLDDFFQHENQVCLTSLWRSGSSTKKNPCYAATAFIINGQQQSACWKLVEPKLSVKLVFFPYIHINIRKQGGQISYVMCTSPIAWRRTRGAREEEDSGICVEPYNVCLESKRSFWGSMGCPSHFPTYWRYVWWWKLIPTSVHSSTI